MQKNHIIVGIIGGVVIAGASFWSGMHYGSATTAGTRTLGQGSQFAGRQGGGFRASGNGALFGTIVSVDASSITVKLNSGPSASSINGTESGSKIVILDSNTQVGKFVVGTQSDLKEGESVLVNGFANSDGSVTAQNIQIRPAGATGPGGGQFRSQSAQ